MTDKDHDQTRDKDEKTRSANHLPCSSCIDYHPGSIPQVLVLPVNNDKSYLWAISHLIALTYAENPLQK